MSSQCCPNTSETTLHQKITCATYAMLPWSAWTNLAQNNYAHNADNVGLQSMLSQSSQYSPNTAETTLHKKITGAILAQFT